jgi:hypothetical protein
MGIVGWSVLSKQVVNIANAHEHPYDKKGHIVGALELLNKDTGSYSDADMVLIREKAHALGQKADLSLADMGPSEAKTLVQELMDQTNSERGSLFIVDQEASQLWSAYAHGLEESDINLNMKLGIAGFGCCFRTGA